MPEDNTLNDICKSSMLNATKALSKVVQTPIGLHIKSIEVNHIDDINKLMKGDKTVVTLSSPITGKLKGASFLIYTKETAFTICDILLNRTSGITKKLSDLEISALSEVANIVFGNFLTSFAHSLQIDILVHQAATFYCAPFSELYAQILRMLSKNVKHPFFKISFDFQHSKLKGYIIIVFDEKIIHAALKKIGIKHT